MDKISKIRLQALLLNEWGHEIIIREYQAPDGRLRTYIKSINGNKFKINDQYRARAKLEQIMEVELNERETSEETC